MHMDRRTFLIATGFTAVTIFPPSAATAAAWVELGRKPVGANGATGKIGVSRSYGRIGRFRIGVTGGNVKIESATIYFEDGTSRTVQMDQLVARDGFSRIVKLGDSTSAARYISVRYGKYSDGRGGTYIHLWGRH